jgi:osomolarity two-component system phosphorelay intermediate protein YPD1
MPFTIVPALVGCFPDDGCVYLTQTSSLPSIDMETFNQIIDLDEDDETYDFSWGMAWAYFSQAKSTFEEMNQAL